MKIERLPGLYFFLEMGYYKLAPNRPTTFVAGAGQSANQAELMLIFFLPLRPMLLAGR